MRSKARYFFLISLCLLSPIYGKTGIFIDQDRPVFAEPITGRIEVQNDEGKEILLPVWKVGHEILSANAILVDKGREDTIKAWVSVCCSFKGPVKLAAGQSHVIF